MSDVHVEVEFPLFMEWPSDKIYFLEYMSCEQTHVHRFGQTKYSSNPPDSQVLDSQVFDSQVFHPQLLEREEEEVPCYVVVRDGFQDESEPTHKCRMCNDRLSLVYNNDEEEWVYDDCREFQGLPYHYPYCYNYAMVHAAPK